MVFETIPHKILTRGRERGSAAAYAVRSGSGWNTTSWDGYAGEVEDAAKALIALGLDVGASVAILGTNTPHWVIFDVAAMAVGATPAGIYPTSSPDEAAYIINHSRSPIVLAQNEAQLAKILEKSDELPDLRTVVLMPGAASDAPNVLSWNDFIAAGARVTSSELDRRLAGLGPRDGATLIYTSGTTGPPKAVLLPHEALTSTVEAIQTIVDVGIDDDVISYLPLSHIAEQIVSIHAPAVMGHTVYYEPEITRLADTIKEVRPTAFFAVPRVWEKFHTGIEEKLAEASGVRAALASRAMAVGRAYMDDVNNGKTPGGLLGIQHGLFDKVVYAKVKAALGFDRCRFMFSSAAPLSPVIADFFAGLDMQVIQLYGQSECTGICAFNRPDWNRVGSVGPALPGTELRIAEDGEILVRGANVFLGYLHNPEATSDALDPDGWLRTGDVGHIDDGGFLFITDRKKDIIITAGGENVTPSEMEMTLQTHALIANAVVVGDARPYLTVLISIDEEGAAGLSEQEIHAQVQQAVDDLNAATARVRQLKKYTILDHPLSIEGGELTPTLKVKRKIVREHFSEAIEAMYE